jgi:hypothetical protein
MWRKFKKCIFPFITIYVPASKRIFLHEYDVVIPAGLEPATYRLGICRSILMSYGTTALIYARIDIYFPVPSHPGQ